MSSSVAADRSPRARDELQTLRRGLEALEFINLSGMATVGTLAAHLAIPRPNAHRILQTLLGAGYCNRIPDSGSYIVAPAVRRLSAGLRAEEMLTNVSIPIVTELGGTLDWPVALAIACGTRVVARLTTDKSAPMALIRIPPGHPGHLLRTTSGLLSVAYGPQEARDELIDAALDGQTITDFFPSRAYLHRLLDESLVSGHILLHGEYSESCLGVPIVRDGRFRGALVLRYIRVAMSDRRCLDECLPAIAAARDRIVAALAAIEGADEESAAAAVHPQSGHVPERG